MKGAAFDYHNSTSYERSKMDGHYLDWQNQPKVFKTYEGLKTVPMPREVPFPREDFFPLFDKGHEREVGDALFDLELLSKILLMTYTVTAKMRQPGGNFHFRSAASAGALYPTEIYVLSDGLKDLEDGLYHFSVLEHGLVKLKDGTLPRAAKGFNSPLTFFLTAIFYRSAWKYRNRSYRYHLLDTGHVLANLELAVTALKLPLAVTFDFEDKKVNQLLGLDDSMEVALAVCGVKGKCDLNQAVETMTVTDLPEKIKKASRVSPKEFQLPEIQTIHKAGYDITGEREGRNMSDSLGIVAKSRDAFQAGSEISNVMPYPEAVFRRRSSRNFVTGTLEISLFEALLKVFGTTGETDMDGYSKGVCTGLITRGVESLEDGFYLLHEKPESLGIVTAGAFTRPMSRICLNQEWMANASLHFLFMTNMKKLEEWWGPRGYRHAMMNAGIWGERLYLAASALGLGCCGIGAFYDGEASRLLGLNPPSRLLYVVTVGAVKSMRDRDSLT